MDRFGFLLVCATVLAVAQCQELQFFAEPSNVVNDTTDSLEITCKAPGILADVNLIILMQVDQVDGNKSTTIASRRMGSKDGTVVLVEDERKTAEGELNGGKTAYITVTIASPVKEDTGVYRCRFAYLDMSVFKFNLLEETVNVTFTEPDEPTPEPVAVGDCSCDQVWVEVKNLRETLIAENTELKNQLMSYDDSCRVSFTAKLEGRLGPQFRSNGLVVFDTVTSNKGEAYDGEKGIFTAPCNGQYFIRLTMRTHQTLDAGYVDGALEVNGDEVARTSVFTEDQRDHYEQASNGLVLTLKKGDEVQVRVQTNSGGRIFGDVFSFFTGFFISP